MNKNHTSTDITRREALKTGAGVVPGSLAVGLGRAMELMTERSLQMIPVYFNGCNPPSAFGKCLGGQGMGRGC